jgi:hypothetical protein
MSLTQFCLRVVLSLPNLQAAREIRLHGLLQEKDKLKKVNRLLQHEKEKEFSDKLS